MTTRWMQIANRVRSARPLPMGRVAGVAPIFIVGMGRSGTTLLRLVINAHPDLAIIGETNAFLRQRRYGGLSDVANLRLFTNDWRQVFAHQSPHPDLLERPGLMAELARTQTYAEAMNLVMSSYAAREGKTRWGEKTPSHVRRLEMIFDAFPEAQVIHLVRDPRAVVVSRIQTFGRSRFGDSEVYRFGRAWRRNIDKLDEYRNDSARYISVRYEDLVHHPETTLRDLCRFLGVDFALSMLDFHTEASLHAPRSKDGGVTEIHKLTVETFRPDRVEQWRNILSPRHSALVEMVAGGAMREFGYDSIVSRDQRPHRLRIPLIVAVANMRAGYERMKRLLGRVAWAGRRQIRSRYRRAPDL